MSTDTRGSLPRPVKPTPVKPAAGGGTGAAGARAGAKAGAKAAVAKPTPVRLPTVDPPRRPASSAAGGDARAAEHAGRVQGRNGLPAPTKRGRFAARLRPRRGDDSLPATRTTPPARSAEAGDARAAEVVQRPQGRTRPDARPAAPAGKDARAAEHAAHVQARSRPEPRPARTAGGGDARAAEVMQRPQGRTRPDARPAAPAGNSARAAEHAARVQARSRPEARPAAPAGKDARAAEHAAHVQARTRPEPRPAAPAGKDARAAEHAARAQARSRPEPRPARTAGGGDARAAEVVQRPQARSRPEPRPAAPAGNGARASEHAARAQRRTRPEPPPAAPAGNSARAAEHAGRVQGRSRPESRPAAVREPKPTRQSKPQSKPAPKPAPKPTPAPRPVRPTRPDPSPTPVHTATAAPVRIDPRIKRRRIEVMRDEGRRRLKVLIASVAVIAVLLSVVGATRSPVLDVDHVLLTGATRTTQEQIVTATGLHDKPQLIDVSTGSLAEQIERLPWVATAEATREWPATIRVTVTERTPAASTPAAGGMWAVVDGTGRVLENVPERPATMPSVDGLALAGAPGTELDAEGRDAMKVAANLPESVRTVTVQLAVTPDGEIQLHIFPAGVVRMGDSSQLAQKLESVVTVLNTLAPKSWRVLDVRVPRAPVLTRR